MVRVELDATLTDINGNPLPNKTINFYYRQSGETTWSSAGSRVTDSSGRASVTIDLSPGTYDFRAEFPGDDVYAPSYAEVTGYAVKTPTVVTVSTGPSIPWPLILLLLLALLALAGRRGGTTTIGYYPYIR